MQNKNLGVLVGLSGDEIVTVAPFHSWDNLIQRTLDNGLVYDTAVIINIDAVDRQSMEIQARNAVLLYPDNHVEPWPVEVKFIQLKEERADAADLFPRHGVITEAARSTVQASTTKNLAGHH